MATYALTVEAKGSYLHAVVRGENGPATVIAYFVELRRACVARDCYRILVEERLDGPRLPPDELMQVMAQVAANVGATFEAVAYVDVNAVDDTISAFAPKVVEPGASVGVFGSVDAAERWLRAKE